LEHWAHLEKSARRLLTAMQASGAEATIIEKAEELSDQGVESTNILLEKAEQMLNLERLKPKALPGIRCYA
jgi:hypothetical protein